jgi:plasmid maintenance system antidote protein VapI
MKLMFHQMKFSRGNINYMIENPTTLGEWIRVCLREMGKNQAWLAEKIGVQPPQVSRIISGSSETTPEILIAIADALGKSRTQVFRIAGYIEKVTKTDEEREQILYETQDLTPQEKQEILAFIRMKKNLRKKNGHR